MRTDIIQAAFDKAEPPLQNYIIELEANNVEMSRELSTIQEILKKDYKKNVDTTGLLKYYEEKANNSNTE